MISDVCMCIGGILTWTVAEKETGEGEERGWSGCLLLIFIQYVKSTVFYMK